MRFGIEIPENPKTIQEKLIWLQFYDPMNYLKPICADKLKIREYAKEKIGKDVCVPLIKAYGSPDEIRFSELPDRFVLKTNHSNGQVMVVRDKSKADEAAAKAKIKDWLSRPFGVRTCEPHYMYIERKCYAEKFISNPDGRCPTDYKFFCFNGKAGLLQAECEKGTPNERFQYYDMNLKLTDVSRKDHPSKPELAARDVLPKKFGLMKEYAEKLAAPFRFVRVDFYEIGEEVYLGEMTFVPGAARLFFKNPATAIELGNMIKL